MTDTLARVAELEAALEDAEVALEFYAEPYRYRQLSDPDDELPPVLEDEGGVARDAIKAIHAALAPKSTPTPTEGT